MRTIAPAAALLLIIGASLPTSHAHSTTTRRVVPVARSADAAPGLRAPGAWRWPLAGSPHLVRRFDPPPQPWLPGHRGVDLAAAPESPVLAAGGGTVVYAGVLAGRGVVSVDHPSGLRTTYEPVTPLVKAGDTVTAGTPLGILAAGHPGCSATACLHWGLRRGTVYLDPLAVLGLGRVRLLPGGRPTPGRSLFAG
ncbi:murein hydrolase activator EnvC family protein [Catellatospora chokoriensis]|uniref:Peptidase n=1 Tax=Catellatospora chokoriensis TaxID=310353 RepID=A0A8J3KCJ4_9ACTN|nr:M23 family metallopeptidase [Catellatospora chokoriensis]GIF92589.1 peptidase [Catellatospora chokoriensis]